MWGKIKNSPKGKFDEALVRYYTNQILNGLNYLHFKKIIHRDLKAKNILLSEENTLKLTDFGLSKRLSKEILTSRQFTTLKGTCTHLAPEIVKNTRYGRKVDIW